MALFKTRSAAVYGIDAHLIDVEVDMYASGNAARLRHGRHAGHGRAREPRAHQIGAPELRLRLPQQGRHHQPGARPTCARRAPVSICPWPSGILGAMGAGAAPRPAHLLVGELSLDGAMRPVRGALSVAVCARDQGIREPRRAGRERRRSGRGRGRPRVSACGTWPRWWRC